MTKRSCNGLFPPARGWKVLRCGLVPKFSQAILLAILSFALCSSAAPSPSPGKEATSQKKPRERRPPINPDVRSFPGWVPTPAGYEKRDSWQTTLLAARLLLSTNGANWREMAGPLWDKLDRDFPIPSDWLLQDLQERRQEWFGPEEDHKLERDLLAGPLDELGGTAPEKLRQAALTLLAENPPRQDSRWLDLYVRLCETRRATRLKTVLAQAPRMVFAKHFNMGGSHYAYTEGLSDANAERCFFPGSELCLLEMNGLYGRVTNLVDDPHGVIRDPNVSWDGQRVVFAWKKSDRLDDYHLYEMELASRAVRQITFGLGFADYEPAYLPEGDIIFNSSRCVQAVDCWWTEVSNLYACDPRGRKLRRLNFDQVHVNFPQVLDDGSVVYTRWEYNDRGQIYVQCLFEMNPDGTAQKEFYGINSWFPTTLLHARGIPGTHQVAAIATGHHSSQAGKLVLVDPARGRQENEGVQLIAPVRETKAVKVDGYGQDGPLWMYPYPLNEKEFLVTYAALGKRAREDRHGGWFGIFYMDKDGRRELLAADPDRSCSQAVPLTPRTPPQPRASVVDYRQKTGTYYIQDVYAGPGLQGVPRGAARTLRVVALEYRVAAIGANGNGGVAGGALVCTPPSVSNGAWDVKRVLGLVPIAEDGSALFRVPARTPVYFQVLDASNHVIQTMRSWSTLQPGEYFSCVGCHEHKNASPPPLVAARPKHSLQSPQVLDGSAPGFSFVREIQPILERACVRCHDGAKPLSPASSASAKTSQAQGQAPASTREGNFEPDLTATPVLDPGAKRTWTASYLALTSASKRLDREKTPREYRAAMTPLVNWVHPQSAPPMLPPYESGSARSKLITMLETGHGNVSLSRQELDRFACWIDLAGPFCGDYVEANTWTEPEKQKYQYFLEKRKVMEKAEGRGLESLLRHKQGQPEPALPSTELSIEIVDGSGKVLGSQKAQSSADQPLQFAWAHPWKPGDRIRVTGAQHMALKLDALLPEAFVFCPERRYEFVVPVHPAEKRAYPPQAFNLQPCRITARPITTAELDAYRNLASNPLDKAGQTNSYPHAASNSECRNESVFAARNAIDGFRANQKHGGWPWQSWGPDQIKDAWWQVDFGREIELDKIVITIRADFPHDKYWREARLVFSNGARELIHLAEDADPQTFTFRRPIGTRWVRLEGLVPNEPGWCAMSEVEVYGRDRVPVGTDLVIR